MLRRARIVDEAAEQVAAVHAKSLGPEAGCDA
jgi:hypothetical protein